MKKLFVFILVLTMILSMASVAFAEEIELEGFGGYKDQKEVTIMKNVELSKNAQAPTETFKFKIEKFDVKDSLYNIDNMPEFDCDEDTEGVQNIFEIPFNKGDTSKSVTLKLPEYNHVGIFTYKISEIDGNSAGMEYSEPLYLTVYVTTKDGKLYRTVTKLHINKRYSHGRDKGKLIKVEKITNKFKADKLEVYKKVTGNMGERDRYFDVDVTLTAPIGKTVAPDTITASGGSHEDNPADIEVGKTYTFKIKHDETITLNNIPYGVTYDVREHDYTKDPYNYDYTKHDFDDKNNKKIGTGSKDKVTITNHKERTVETGINLDSLPYIFILVITVGGLVIFIARKRFTTNE